MGFKIVPRSTNRIDMGDGDYLEVRKGLSKENFGKVLERLPEDFSDDNSSFNIREANDFTTGLFEALVVGWNAVDEDGNPLPAVVSSYLQDLDRDTAQAVDLALFEYFNGLGLTDKDADKSRKTSR
jgi:hypothetical protein